MRIRTSTLSSIAAIALACRSSIARQPAGDSHSHLDSTAHVQLPRTNPALGPQCPTDTTSGIEVTARCVGPIPVDSPLAYALAHLPKPRVDTGFLEATPVIVWHFDFGGVTAMVSQQDITVDLKSPAFDWHVNGPGVRLSGGTPLPANWGLLRSRFSGPAVLGISEVGAYAEICSLNGVWLKLHFDYDPDAQDTMTAQSIPADAYIQEVAVYPGQHERCP